LGLSVNPSINLSQKVPVVVTNCHQFHIDLMQEMATEVARYFEGIKWPIRTCTWLPHFPQMNTILYLYRTI